MKLRRIGACLALTMALMIGASAQGSGQNDKQFQAALHKEMVEGDLKGAIEEYRKVASRPGVGRELAATSLLHVAECYQKLGDVEARHVYEEIIQRYSDQSVAATARARLSVTPAAADRSDDRVVARGTDITWGDGRVSADGRFICYTDWNWTGNLMLHDVAGGSDRALTGNKDWTVGNASSSTFSPDGRQIAYGWRTYANPPVNELRILTLDGTGTAQPRRIAVSDQVSYYNPTDWSRDGRFLAGTITRNDRAIQIAIIDARDGTVRVLKTVEWGGPGQVFFSPDGKYIAYDLQQGDDVPQRDVFVMSVDAAAEIRVVSSPADDVVMGWSPDGDRLLFASDRTGAVALWGVPMQAGKANGSAALIKPDIGSVKSIGLTASGSLHIVRDASTVGLHIAPIDLAAGKLTGSPVLENFHSGRPAWSFDGKQIAYDITTSNGLQMLAIRPVDREQVRRVPVSLRYIAEPRWLPDGRSLVTNGADVRGHAGIFRIDAATGQVTRITGMDGPAGRVQASPDGRHIYYGVGGAALRSAAPALVERDLTTGEVREVYRTAPGVGAAELSPDGEWIAVVNGEYAKSSAVLVYPVAGGEPRELFRMNHPDALQAYGGISWAPDNQHLIVINDAFDAATGRFAPKDLWLLSLDVDKPRKLDIDVRDWEGSVRLSADGRYIAFSSGRDVREVWALEGVTTGRAGNRVSR